MTDDISKSDSEDGPDSQTTPVQADLPSIDRNALLSGNSYNYYSPVPKPLQRPSPQEAGAEAVLGVDEAGRGPVLGPMVYGVFYLPIPLSTPLLKEAHHFDDSKVLTAAVRADLMKKLCTPGTDLHESCGFATAALSARSIGTGMLSPGAGYNLNAQAMDATIALIRGVLGQGVNLREIYVDTIGSPSVYQAKLQREFPGIQVTVAKKADSLYPSVSAASVCAKVTRDVALEVLYSAYKKKSVDGDDEAVDDPGWGSGYPSDGRCVSWLKNNMHPVFGWGPECRFSWGTAKDMLELKGGVKVEWPVKEDEDSMKVTDFFSAKAEEDEGDELATWFGRPAGQDCF